MMCYTSFRLTELKLYIVHSEHILTRRIRLGLYSDIKMMFKIRLIVFYICVHGSIVTGSKCLDGSYNNSSTCIPCPSNCATCASDTSCLQCKNGFYGELCKIPCLHNCSTHGCHLQYGHCMQCHDGRFFSKDDHACHQCPETCDVCNSTSNCFRCRNGFYNQDCSKICEVGCEGGTCNQTNGLCLQCKTGYYRQGDTCLQCPQGCTICNNSTYCSACQENYLGLFLGKCFRKCTAKSYFVSKFNHRCGISLEEIKANRSSCLTVNIERTYTCTAFRPCIVCHTEGGDCRNLNLTTNSEVCLQYKECITTCHPGVTNSSIPNKADIIGNTLCTQTCSVNHSGDGNDTLEHLCPIRRKYNTLSNEDLSYIECFQEQTTDVSSSEDQLTVASVVIVGLSVLGILLIGTVYFRQRKRIALSLVRSRSAEVTQEVESVPRYYDWRNQVHGTRTLQRVPSVESVYDRGACSQAVIRNHMFNIVAIPQRRGQIQNDMYDTARCSTFETNNHVYNQICFPLQRRRIPTDMHDTVSSAFDAGYHDYNKICLTVQSPGCVAGLYDTAHPLDVVAREVENNTSANPSQQSEVDHELYDLVYFDKSAPRVVLQTENTPDSSYDGQVCMHGAKLPDLRNQRPDSADANGYSLCKMVHTDVVKLL